VDYSRDSGCANEKDEAAGDLKRSGDLRWKTRSTFLNGATCHRKDVADEAINASTLALRGISSSGELVAGERLG
jgi:hypothetical protein